MVNPVISSQTTVYVKPTPSPKPKPKTKRQQIEDYICSKDWDCETAKRIAMCESSFREKAVNKNKNGTSDGGLYQLNSIHGHSDSCRFDYKCNIDRAYELYLRRGFQPWKASEKCWKVGD